ncbi:hypothetical protein ACRQ5Q_22540 [Bradyrhizobium sp. PMVTL-01]|uniref:hypothetical protein n=1 Tax=Bradyrhizobium sp. PMVTL-01 TaxID=3434999 RepID=UPI003F6EA134
MPPKSDQLVAKMHRDFVKRVVEHTKTPPTRIATDLKIAPSTLTRLLNEPDGGKATLRATTIAKLEAYSGLTAPTLEHPEGATLAPSLREDAVPYESRDGDPTIAAAIKAVIGTRKNIDVWTMQSRALECAGFMPGDIVLVDLSTMPRAGEPACAQVYNFRGGAAETVMRLLEPPYLVAATFDPALRKPLLVDDERVIVKGLILPHRFRPRVS